MQHYSEQCDGFFRDAEAWEYLRAEIMPKMLAVSELDMLTGPLLETRLKELLATRPEHLHTAAE